MAYMNFFELLYLMVDKTFFPFTFCRMAGHKEEDPQPSASGIVKEK